MNFYKFPTHDKSNYIVSIKDIAKLKCKKLDVEYSDEWTKKPDELFAWAVQNLTWEEVSEYVIRLNDWDEKEKRFEDDWKKAITNFTYYDYNNVETD